MQSLIASQSTRMLAAIQFTFLLSFPENSCYHIRWLSKARQEKVFKNPPILYLLVCLCYCPERIKDFSTAEMQNNRATLDIKGDQFSIYFKVSNMFTPFLNGAQKVCQFKLFSPSIFAFPSYFIFDFYRFSIQYTIFFKKMKWLYYLPSPSLLCLTLSRWRIKTLLAFCIELSLVFLGTGFFSDSNQCSNSAFESAHFLNKISQNIYYIRELVFEF